MRSESSEITPNLLNGMNGKIQGEALLSLITKTLTTLEMDYAELRVLLDKNSWQAAAEKAHQLKGSAYLFGCEEIVFFLERISDKHTGLIETETFKNNFRETSRVCLEKLQQALDRGGK